MPKLACKCGQILDLSRNPTRGEYLFFDGQRWDELIDRLVGAVSAQEQDKLRPLDEAISDILAGFGGRFYVCPQCSRLIVFWEGSDDGQFFTPDPPNREQPSGG